MGPPFHQKHPLAQQVLHANGLTRNMVSDVPVAWEEEVEGSGDGGAPAALASLLMADGYCVDGGSEPRHLMKAEGAGPLVVGVVVGLLRRRRRGGAPTAPAAAGLPLGERVLFFHERNRMVVVVKLCGQDKGVLNFHWRA
jgi:hypothetical protein